MPNYAKVGFNYWDGRPPKTKVLPANSEGGTPQIVVEYIDRQLMYPNLADGTPVKLIWDEQVAQYVIFAAKLTDIALDTYALLLKPVPKCEFTDVNITAGYAEEAARALTLAKYSAVDFIEVKQYDVSNPIWPEDILAGSETPEHPGKPIIAKGKIKVIRFSEEPDDFKEVFFLEWITYPITIISGRTTTAVNGGPFSAHTLKVLWGRDPELTVINNIINPDGWTSDIDAYCLIMQTLEGKWQAIDLACKEEEVVSPGG